MTKNEIKANTGITANPSGYAVIPVFFAVSVFCVRTCNLFVRIFQIASESLREW